MEESLIFKGLRATLVERLKEKGIRDINVLNVIARVPRHLFLPTGFEKQAYEDKPFSIACGQTISQPYTVAIQTELLQVQRFDKILEIGTGSGYQAVILAEMGAIVYTVERLRELYLGARRTFRQLGYSIDSSWSDGYEGKENNAPFKGILITAAIPQIPQKLLDQLATGGRLVAPVGKEDMQTMTVVEKISDNEFNTFHHHSPFKFVPMLKGTDSNIHHPAFLNKQ
ncbi:MAG: protein-L-isoaspartate(D-aspartate) O-methyltransferase [Prevotellaceae bacterium]|jgi:protein-L-isoaspartate(D-aspartate) O-methyltransferase|nr:protein-L-isoaspartate(D-aspartate) O-methyltransferase [Prevotellaceae bacterium]